MKKNNHTKYDKDFKKSLVSLPANFLSVPYMFYPLSCKISQIQGINTWFSDSKKNGFTFIGKPFLSP